MMYNSDMPISNIQLCWILLAQGVMFCVSVLALYKMNINYYIIKNSLCGVPCYSFAFLIFLIVLTICGFLIIKNKKNRLIPFYLFGTILINLVLIILSIVGYNQLYKITPVIEQHLKDSMSKYLKKEDNIVNFWNDLHGKFNCCGINSVTDWFYYKEIHNHLPLSCCDQNYEVTDNICTEFSTTLRYDACLKPFANNLEDYYTVFIFVQFVLAIIQLAMVFYKGTYKCFAEEAKIYRPVSFNLQNNFKENLT